MSPDLKNLVSTIIIVCVLAAGTGIFANVFSNSKRENAGLLLKIFCVAFIILGVSFFLFVVFKSEYCPSCNVMGITPYCTECGYYVAGGVNKVCPNCTTSVNTHFCGKCGFDMNTLS